MRRFRLIAALLLACPAIALARGRQPDDEERPDNFPDYNRLEMRPKPKTPAEAPPPVVNTPAAKAPAAPTAPPALNTPVNPGSDEDVPLPPPKVVPLPDSSSEPPMPEDIKDTLIPSTTAQ